MSLDSGTLWHGVLSRIRGRISEQQFETWFRSVEPKTCSEEVLELTVPNSFSREWLRKRYADVILGAVEQASGGRRPALRIMVREGGEVPGDQTRIDPTRDAVAAFGTPSALLPDGADARTRPHPRPASSPAAPPRGLTGPCLNRGFRLGTFVTSPGTELAFAAASAVVTREERLYNPLFIHGGVGMGKTHLLQAIAQEWMERRPESRVVYVSCEHFVNHFILAVERSGLEAFRQHYRTADLLVVDDIQFLVEKEKTQDEFFHMFNILHGRERQIVVSADRRPWEITGLSERLVSRLRSGLTCDLVAPDVAARTEIARRKASALGESLPPEIATYIAETIRSNPRELEGAVTRVVGVASLRKQPLTCRLAQEVLEDLVADRSRKVSIEQVAAAVTQAFGVKLAELQGKRRFQAITLPRQVAMHLARRLTSHSLDQIGGYFGGRDHSTVLYGIDRVESKMIADARFRERVERLETEVRDLAGS